MVVDESCFTSGCAPDKLAELSTCLSDHFTVSITHSTFQLETAERASNERLTPVGNPAHDSEWGLQSYPNLIRSWWRRQRRRTFFGVRLRRASLIDRATQTQGGVAHDHRCPRSDRPVSDPQG